MLSKREIEVLRLLAKGYTMHQIAQKLSITYYMTRTHVSSMLKKLDMISQVHLVIWAHKTRLVTLSEINFGRETAEGQP